MKKFFLLTSLAILLTVGIEKAAAQTQLMYMEVDGVRASRYGNLEVEGSPFLKDDWESGTATNDKGQVYQLKLKYDIAADQVIFADKDDGPMLFTVPIVRFNLKDAAYASGFPAIDDWNTATYYEVLGTGNTKILRHFFKRKLPVRDMSGISGYKYEDNDMYYLLKDGRMYNIKPAKASILSLLNTKQDKLEEYIKANKINFNRDADLAKLIDYYNSI